MHLYLLHLPPVPVLSKPVYTLSIERSTIVDKRLVDKLKAAAKARGIVVTHPTVYL